MNTFIIASHSTFAEGLYNCLKFFKFDIDNVYYINAYVDDMEFEKSFIELVEKLRTTQNVDDILEAFTRA